MVGDTVETEESNFGTNGVFKYNVFFNTNEEEVLIVFDAIVKRGGLATFRSKMLKTSISGKKMSGVLNYFIDIGLMKIVNKEHTYLYKRNFDLKDAEKIRKNLSMEVNLNKILKAGRYNERYANSRTKREILFKTVYAYLRWRMRLHKSFKAIYFLKQYSDCPINSNQITHAMLYAEEKGYLNKTDKKTNGAIYSFDRSFLKKKVPLSEVV